MRAPTTSLSKNFRTAARLLVVFLAFCLCACYVRVNLSKEIPDDNGSYTIFIRKDWNNVFYAVVTDKTEITRLAEELKLKANFGIGGYYYCDGVKYPDGLIIAKDNVFFKGQCLNGIDYLNIDSLGLEFNYERHFALLNRKELGSLITKLRNEQTPFFMPNSDTTYFGRHIYDFNVRSANRKYMSNRDKTGNRIRRELAASTKYKREDIYYRVTSDTTLQFYLEDNDSTARLNSNAVFYKTSSFQHQRYLSYKHKLYYFTRAK